MAGRVGGRENWREARCDDDSGAAPSRFFGISIKTYLLHRLQGKSSANDSSIYDLECPDLVIYQKSLV